MSTPDRAALLDTALYDPDPARRDGARSRLARTASPAEVDALVALLDAPQRGTRRRVARILSEIDPRRARPALRRALADHARPVRLRASAARVLSVLADDCEPALAPALRGDPEPRVRRACATAAADPAALVDALGDDHPEVVERAAAALEWLDDTALDGTAPATHDPAALRAAVRAAATRPDAGPTVRRLLARLDPTAPALAAAAEAGDATALDHLADPAAVAARLDRDPLAAWNLAATHAMPRAIAGAPDAIAGAPDAIASSPDAIASSPDAIASSPDAIARVPDAIAGVPDAAASAPDAIAGAPDATASAPDAFGAVPAATIPLDAIDAIAAHATHPDPRVRAAAARALPPDHPAHPPLTRDPDPGVAWLARRAATGAYTPAALARRLGPHARSDAPSARPPYGLRPGDSIPRARRLPAALALCHPRFDINLGVAVRSAEAAGLREVFLVGRAELFRSPARGTDRILPVRHAPDPAALVRMARAGDYQLVALQQTPDSEPFHRAVYPPRPLFVVGAEDGGVPRPLRAAADLIVEIPMWGAIDSLNVAAATTTLLFHWRAMREAAEMP